MRQKIEQVPLADPTNTKPRHLTTPQLLRRAALRYQNAVAAVLESWQHSCCPEPLSKPECEGCPHLAEFKQLVRDRIRAP